ncbi:M28 family metallopeptidase [Fodinibius sp. Rm-B-1B1-1]|uniref:M28 family metallopeptidase n=1 Tax=Fodinibius alkaliphilus TaxID=3140241 RepID=UPI003159DB62
MAKIHLHRFRTFFIGLLIIGFWVSCDNNRTQNTKETNTYEKKIQDIKAEISADTLEANIRELTSFYTRHTASDTASDTTGIGAARRWVYGQFKDYQQRSNGRLHVQYSSFTADDQPKLEAETEIVNILAYLPGTQLESKDRMYLVTAHYDSRASDLMDARSQAPGASDNASGTAAVLELARVMSNYEFDATIVFLALAGKEQGQLGAKYIAEQASSQNRHIAGILNNDIIGNHRGIKKPDTVRVFAPGISSDGKLTQYQQTLLHTGGENDTPSRQLGRFMYHISEKYFNDVSVDLIYRKDRYWHKGDHLAFLEYDYPSVRISQLTEKHRRHDQDVRTEDGKQYGDLPKFINFDYTANVTRLNAITLATLADAPAPPTRVKIVIDKSFTDTRLKWKSNKEPDFKGYNIVWRRPSQPHWQHSKFVGDTLEYRLKDVPRDNFIFGVRSVDNFGHESPAVFPTPAL